jgi:aldose sugar dehydrogenase
MTQNYLNSTLVDGRSGILRVDLNSKTIYSQGILGDEHPLDYYYAYGIRNSFGIDFDPLTGNLWDTENGPAR